MSADDVRAMFTFLAPGLRRLADRFGDDGMAALDEATKRFESMITGLAYVDEPSHPMAMSSFFCSANLAMYLVLRDRGVDVHDFGRAVVADFTPRARADLETEEQIAEELAKLRAAAEESQTAARPGEFVFDVVDGDADSDWGMNVTSCGICAQFSKYDAMELVPYMCSLDDVISDGAGRGLRRTGTIAVGAHHCDFRYQQGGVPVHLADQYPDRIRLRRAGLDPL